jgi:hypothetical protein
MIAKNKLKKAALPQLFDFMVVECGTEPASNIQCK